MPMRHDPVKWFWTKVDKINDLDSCWEWLGAKNFWGYGAYAINNHPDWKRNQRAHKFSYIITNGPVPEGMVVRHTCDNRGCVRPDHLVLGTYADNAQDAVERKRLNPRYGRTYWKTTTPEEDLSVWVDPSKPNWLKKHCHRGHEFTDSSTRITKTGKKECRECQRTSSLDRYYRLKAEGSDGNVKP